VKQAIQEFLQEQRSKSEPAYKTELVEERKRREQLERRLNEVEEESKRSRQAAEQAERGAAIRAELQRLGVAKVDLAYRAVHEAFSARRTAGCWRTATSGEVPLKGIS
jgi:UDP-N-acetylmuramyl tripeptide synthase